MKTALLFLVLVVSASAVQVTVDYSAVTPDSSNSRLVTVRAVTAEGSALADITLGNPDNGFDGVELVFLPVGCRVVMFRTMLIVDFETYVYTRFHAQGAEFVVKGPCTISVSDSGYVFAGEVEEFTGVRDWSLVVSEFWLGFASGLLLFGSWLAFAWAKRVLTVDAS